MRRHGQRTTAPLTFVRFDFDLVPQVGEIYSGDTYDDYPEGTSGKTLAHQGCALSSLCMLWNHAAGLGPDDPGGCDTGKMNEALKQENLGGFVPDGNGGHVLVWDKGCKWDSGNRKCRTKDDLYRPYFDSGTALDDVKRLLEQKEEPLILMVEKGGGTHYVITKALGCDGEVAIADPAKRYGTMQVSRQWLRPDEDRRL